MAAINTRLTEKYQLETPIVQAGMAFAGMAPPLCIAVCEAGAMGSIACVGIIPPEGNQQQMAGTQAGTDKPFHENYITPYTTDAHIAVMAETRPAAVSFHWGAPEASWVSTLKEAGIDIWVQVGSVDDARQAVDGGADVIVSQGSEAGGHNYGAASLLCLTPLVVDAVGADALVVAAGGISDGRGLAAALALGADGAWIGTRFVASEEAMVADEYKDRLVASGIGDTVITHMFGRHHPEFNPMRVLENRIVSEWSDRYEEVPADNSAETLVGRMDLFGEETELRKFTNMVPMKGATGDFDEFPLLSGEGVGLVRNIRPAAEIVKSLTDEAKTALNRLQ